MYLRRMSYLAGALCLAAGAAWQASGLHADDPPPDAPPQGVDVQARGPVHEAYAEPADVRPEPGPIIPKQPPDPVAEQPPDQKPAGDDVVWIPGYWSWDDEGSTFTWVSGFWRAPPPGRAWTPGHWQEVDGGWQWVPGLWAAQDVQQVEYLPPPPPSIDEGASTPAPDETSIYVPGCWVYHETRYLWRPGYWNAFNPDWVWIPDHYCWTPAGYLFAAGYWDFPLEGRGLLFAPVRFDAALLAQPGWVYTPEYAVEPDFLMTALFVRPAYSHYYFGDYFEDRYERSGFTAWVDYRVGRGGFDPNFAFYRHRYREDRGWDAALRDLYVQRREGQIARPPRTWAQQGQALNKLAASRTENAAINEKLHLTNLQNVTALTSIRRAKEVRATGLATITGARTPEVKATGIQLEALSKERRGEADRSVKEYRDFATARQHEQTALLSSGGAPVKPTDPPKAVKVHPPTLPARPQEPRPDRPTEQKPPRPAPPPPPTAPAHEERPIPPHEPPKPAGPPKTPAPGLKEPPPAPPKEPSPPPKEPPTPPKEPSPPRREPTPPPPAPPKEPPAPAKEPPAPPKEPPAPPRREPPAPPPPAPKEPAPPPKEPPAPAKEPAPPPKEPPAPPRREPPAPPPPAPKEPAPPPKEPPAPSKPPPAPPPAPPPPPKEPPAPSKPPPAPPPPPAKEPPAPSKPPPAPSKEPPAKDKPPPFGA